MDRRKFLVLGGAAIASIGGCQVTNPFDQRDRIRILGLLGAIPSKVINQFESASQKKVEFKAENLPSKLWQELQNYPNIAKDKAPNLMSLGDSWLDQAIAQSLIQPITPNLLEKIPKWQKLSPLWQQSVTRNDQVWGIPYRWGATAIAYRSDKLKFEITQWADLWRPELKRKLTLPDDAREVIGLSLKKMGLSYQLEDLVARPDVFAKLTQELKSLNSQVLTYSSDNYLQSLLADDTLVAVGWTSDMYKAQRTNPNLKVVIPQDGTALWSDIWVIPKGEVAIASLDWMNFCLTPEIAAQITSLTDAVSPSGELEQVPSSVKSDPIKFFSQDILAKSELISPLSPSTLTQYKDLWTKLRSGTL
jgi:putative spermidine/putrescine transport system substrate-binding protein